MNLRTPITDIKGVGPKTGEKFVGAGIATAGDLINLYPRTYDDYSGAENIADIKPGKVTLRARVESISTRYARRNLKITTATLVDDNDDKVQAVWFNQPFRERQLKAGGQFYFSGDFKLQYGRYQLSSPKCEAAKDMPLKSDNIVPVYSLKNGLKMSTLKTVITNVKPLIAVLPENLPFDVVADGNLMSHSDAVMEAHFPTSRDKLKQARSRLAFEELYSLILAARMNRDANQRIKARPIKFTLDNIKTFVANLPFTMTSAQRRAAWEILQDFGRDVPMDRLLQGDVGSGKTVVAALAAYQAKVDGYQTAIMVPTEVLATQHAATFANLLSGLNVNVALLTGSVKGKARDEVLEKLKNCEIDIIIGTHALFQPNVEFQNLGFVVIDEQHRFGVRQRQELLDKTGDKYLPHLLAMTATPIPRSLQLTVFGDVDVSTLNELPKGRQVVETKIIMPANRQPVTERVRAELAAGHQIYYIAKLIEEKEDSEKTSADVLYKKVVKAYPGVRVGILHGKMPAETKEKIMREFEAHETDILVSTTVVEVGVDVPNATVMVIENADQFGLAQLHQLRGRVGRGDAKSYCFVVQTDGGEPSRRLKEIERSNDGFHLAEVDLAMRGAGEIYGTAQHGDLNLKVANLADTKMIKRASDAAKATIEQLKVQPDYLENYPELQQLINKYQKLTTLN